MTKTPHVIRWDVVSHQGEPIVFVATTDDGQVFVAMDLPDIRQEPDEVLVDGMRKAAPFPPEGGGPDVGELVVDDTGLNAQDLREIDEIRRRAAARKENR